MKWVDENKKEKEKRKEGWVGYVSHVIKGMQKNKN